MKHTKRQIQWWCSRQRKAYKEGRLTFKQIAALEALPNWSWEARGFMKYEELVALVASKNLNSQESYQRWVKAENPVLVPFNPNRVYDEWQSWSALFGKNRNTTPDYFEGEQITKDNAVIMAEKIAASNHGRLPVDLRKSYPRLYRMMTARPKEFKHIKRMRILDSTVEIARKLVKEHHGVLPNSQWLKDNGYGAMYHAIRMYPEKFKGIRQKQLSIGSVRVIGIAA